MCSGIQNSIQSEAEGAAVAMKGDEAEEEGEEDASISCLLSVQHPSPSLHLRVFHHLSSSPPRSFCLRALFLAFHLVLMSALLF